MLNQKNRIRFAAATICAIAGLSLVGCAEGEPEETTDETADAVEDTANDAAEAVDGAVEDATDAMDN